VGVARAAVNLRDRQAIALSRNTIKKYFASGAVEPWYSKRLSLSKLDPNVDKLSPWLKAELTRNRKQQRTLLQMHADLVALDLDGLNGRYNQARSRRPMSDRGR